MEQYKFKYTRKVCDGTIVYLPEIDEIKPENKKLSLEEENNLLKERIAELEAILRRYET